MTTFCGLYIVMLDFDRSNWILIYHFDRLCILPYPLHCLVQLYVSTFDILVSICFILVHCLVYYEEFLQLFLVFVVS